MPCKAEDLGFVGLWDWPLALIVMPWDIDDTAQRKAPHYPKSLVAHHRQQRGCSTECPSEPCSPLPTPAPGPRGPRSEVRVEAAPLSQWQALVCDGDEKAVAAALQLAATGLDLDEQRRTLFSSLADAGQVLYADLKDNDTLAAQMQKLVSVRGAALASYW